MEKKLADLLLSLHTDQKAHSFRSLHKHLEGTYNILKEWGNNEAICLAGLFHSIYGTNTFKNQSIELSKRCEVRKVIGDKAEDLAFLFCTTNRKFIKALEKRPFYLKSIVSEEIIEVNEEKLKALIEIEAANLLEQFPHLIFQKKRIIRKIKKMITDAEQYLSKNAIQSLYTVVKKYDKFPFSLLKF
ncbi:DUF6817 domain-containing protein [Sphingobacterium kitahiroshimense]|uniref:DUF6817 domain-containing protein n=1 Tax=Sphingobacterium kitahiroshimense TaxID=470446 RepID=A0ABV0BV01_9SPHI